MDALDGHLRGPDASAPIAATAKAGKSASASQSDAEKTNGESIRDETTKGGGGQDEAKGDQDEGGAAAGNSAPPSVQAGASEAETIAGVVMVGGKGAGRRALIEYVMLAGVNDTEECGRQLGELLKVRTSGVMCDKSGW